MRLLGQGQEPSKIGGVLFSFTVFLILFYIILLMTSDHSHSDAQNGSNRMGVQAPNVLSHNMPPRSALAQIPDEVISVETQRFLMSFSAQQGTISHVQLKDYKDGHGQLFDLTPNTFEWDKKPLLYTVSGYKFDQGFKVDRRDQNHIVFTQNANGLVLEKHYTVSPNQFDLGLKIVLRNTTHTPVDLNAYLSWGIGLGPFIPKEDRVQYDTIISTAYYNPFLDKEVKINKGVLSQVSNVGWLGIDNRYFLMAMIPEQQGRSLVNINYLEGDAPYGQFVQLGNHLSIPAEGSVEQNFTIFLGPKQQSLLASYHKNLERVTERGWFFFPLLGHFLLNILSLLEGVVKSYGVAIILFALLLRLIFHPLNMQSMIATSKQAELQVKVQAIKEKYTDKQTQNIKIMELYKLEQVSLLKGCLPLLLQIPFFISFYQQLPYIIDLAQSHFLWIKDLSSPDTVFHIQAFKNIALLPYRFNILPIIITLATLGQMLLTTRTQRQTSQTKMMVYLMPIVFLFILWNAPAALNLYWLTQTVATMAVQVYFNKNKERILEADRLKRKSRSNLRTQKRK